MTPDTTPSRPSTPVQGSAAPAPGATPRTFATTRWTVVLQAAAADAHTRVPPAATAALEQLCQCYWYPLYAYVRRRGYSPPDAEDLTQSFFARLLDKAVLGVADPGRGRFRSFLLASLKHFLANEWDHRQAGKRGGGILHVELDAQSAETRYRLEPADPGSGPEGAFERQWALALLDRVLGRLRAEAAAAGNQATFGRLETFLTAAGDAGAYAAVARELGSTEGAVKVAVHRLRKRYRALLREEIAHTVASPADIDDELRALVAVLSN